MYIVLSAETNLTKENEMSKLIAVTVSLFWARQLEKVMIAQRFTGSELAEYARTDYRLNFQDSWELANWAMSL